MRRATLEVGIPVTVRVEEGVTPDSVARSYPEIWQYPDLEEIGRSDQREIGARTGSDVTRQMQLSGKGREKMS